MADNKNHHPQLTGAEIIWVTLVSEGVGQGIGHPPPHFAFEIATTSLVRNTHQ